MTDTPIDGLTFALELAKILLPLFTAVLGFLGGYVVSRQHDKSVERQERRSRLRERTVELIAVYTKAFHLRPPANKQEIWLYTAEVEKAKVAYELEHRDRDIPVITRWLDKQSNDFLTEFLSPNRTHLAPLGARLDAIAAQLSKLYTGEITASQLVVSKPSEPEDAENDDLLEADNTEAPNDEEKKD